MGFVNLFMVFFQTNHFIQEVEKKAYREEIDGFIKENRYREQDVVHITRRLKQLN